MGGEYAPVRGGKGYSIQNTALPDSLNELAHHDREQLRRFLVKFLNKLEVNRPKVITLFSIV